MKRISLAALVVLSLMLAVPAVVAQELEISVGETPVSMIAPGTAGVRVISGPSDLAGEASTGVCCQLFGNCVAETKFDVGSVFVLNTYFTDISNAGNLTYLYSLGVKLDSGNLPLIVNAPVNFDVSNIPAGEDFTGCIYVPIVMPNFFAGTTVPWGAGIISIQTFEQLQGKLGTFMGTTNAPQ